MLPKKLLAVAGLVVVVGGVGYALFSAPSTATKGTINNLAVRGLQRNVNIRDTIFNRFQNLVSTDLASLANTSQQTQWLVTSYTCLRNGVGALNIQDAANYGNFVRNFAAGRQRLADALRVGGIASLQNDRSTIEDALSTINVSALSMAEIIVRAGSVQGGNCFTASLLQQAFLEFYDDRANGLRRYFSSINEMNDLYRQLQ